MQDITRPPGCSRREFLQATAALGGTLLSNASGLAGERPSTPQVPRKRNKAQIAITLDLEMSRNFPVWEATHWDYEKGNLNEPTKKYAVEAARRVRAAGGVLHFFAVGRVLEQPDVTWLRELIEGGHPVGNHTYDHVNVTASTIEQVQYRFRRAPWLVRGMQPAEVIRENIRLCSLAMQSRLKAQPNGFRTPGGFRDGLREHPAVRAMLRELGFNWVSSLYPPHLNTMPHQKPTAEVLDSIVTAHAGAQPFAYPDGLVEVPMSPISDIGAFRTGRWKIEWFLEAIRQCVAWTISHQGVFDFLAHPSCLYVVDPQFRAIELICRMVQEAGDQVELVGLDAIARTTAG